MLGFCNPCHDLDHSLAVCLKQAEACKSSDRSRRLLHVMPTEKYYFDNINPRRVVCSISGNKKTQVSVFVRGCGYKAICCGTADWAVKNVSYAIPSSDRWERTER